MPQGSTLEQEALCLDTKLIAPMRRAILDTLDEGSTVHIFRRKLRPVRPPRWYVDTSLTRAKFYQNDRLDLRLFRDRWNMNLYLAPSAMTESLEGGVSSFVWSVYAPKKTESVNDVTFDWMKDRTLRMRAMVNPPYPILRPPLLLSDEESMMNDALSDCPFFRRVQEVLDRAGSVKWKALAVRRHAGVLPIATLATLFFQPLWTALYVAAHPSKMNIYVLGKGLKSTVDTFLTPAKVEPLIMTPTLEARRRYMSFHK